MNLDKSTIELNGLIRGVPGAEEESIAERLRVLLRGRTFDEVAEEGREWQRRIRAAIYEMRKVRYLRKRRGKLTLEEACTVVDAIREAEESVAEIDRNLARMAELGFLRKEKGATPEEAAR